MKNIKFILFLFILAFGSTSCKKEYPATPSAFSPQFTFSGTINSANVNLQAGVNNYYMFTSRTPDMNGVYDFIGELKDETCTSNCTNALKISIKDYRQYSVGPTAVDTSIAPGFYSFATSAGAPSKYYVSFYDSLFNGTALSYSWNFGDGTTSNQHHPLHVYSHPGVYSVSLNTQSTTTCSSSLVNQVVVGQTGGLIQISFSGNVNGNTINFATTSGGGVAPYSYSWDFGDGNNLTTLSPTTNNTYSSSGIYLVKLVRTDAVGNVQTCNRNFAIATTSCYVNAYPNLISPSSNTMNLADVNIEWRDASGTLYTSNGGTQPANSMFKIISVLGYANNISGQPTKRIRARIRATLYNGTNTVIIDGDAVFALAHL